MSILPTMGVCVGVPCSRPVMPEWAISLAIQVWPTNLNICYIPMRGLPVDKAREAIVESARMMKAPYLWMIDDDVEMPYFAARQLIQSLKQAPDDVMVMGGIYPSRANPVEPILYQKNGVGAYWKWKKDTIFDVASLGTGCMMIKTEIFDKIEKPWFKTIFDNEKLVTDDIYFCDKVTSAGYRIQADAHVLCEHWDNANLKRYEFPDDCYPKLPAGKEEWFQALPQGWMSVPELLWLSEQAGRRKQIVELGCYMGRSTVVMAKSTTGKVWAIDDWKGPRNTSAIAAQQTYRYEAAQEGLLEKFKENVAGLENVECVVSDHRQAEIPVTPDMVFVDGDHEYESVRHDIATWKERLAPGGLLCGHDADWPGVKKALDELVPTWKLEAGSIWSVQP